MYFVFVFQLILLYNNIHENIQAKGKKYADIKQSYSGDFSECCHYVCGWLRKSFSSGDI